MFGRSMPVGKAVDGTVQSTVLPLTSVTAVAATPLTSSSPGVSELPKTGSLKVTMMSVGGWTSAPAAGVVPVTTKDDKAPVAPVASKPYSPKVPSDDVTAIVQLPAAPAGTVKSITEFRPSGALPSAMATRFPLLSNSNNSGSKVLTNSFGPPAGVVVVNARLSPALTLTEYWSVPLELWR